MHDINALGTEKISKLIVRYSVPAIIAMMVNAIYNVIDRMFIGQYVGEQALAGLTITFPLTTVLFSFALLIGIGAGNLVSNKLGEKDINGSSEVFGTAVTFGLITTIILCGLSYIFRSDLLVILGGSPDIIPYAEEYLNIILLGFIFVMISYILNSTIRSEGKVMITTISMISACCTNIILDYVFIALMGTGVKGAAVATVLGQFVGLVISALFYLRGQSVLHLTKQNFKLNIQIVNEISRIGLSSFIINIGGAISLVIMNYTLNKYGGSDPITAISVAFSIQQLVLMPIFGLSQGLQAIIGYNYGAKKIDRVYETLFTGLKMAGVFSIISFIILESSPRIFTLLFLKPDSDIFNLTINAIRINFLLLPYYFINVIGLVLFQGTNKGTLANRLTIAKQIFIVPIILVLPSFMGVYGVFISIPIAEFFAFIIITILIIKEYREDSKIRLA